MRGTGVVMGHGSKALWCSTLGQMLVQASGRA
jgi:hypothetical protein